MIDVFLCLFLKVDFWHLTNRRTWKLQLTAIILKTWGTSCAQDLSGKLGKPWKAMYIEISFPCQLGVVHSLPLCYLPNSIPGQSLMRSPLKSVAFDVLSETFAEFGLVKPKRSLTTPSSCHIVTPLTLSFLSLSSAFGTQSIDSSLKALGIWTSEKGWRTGMHHVIYVGSWRERFVVY